MKDLCEQIMRKQPSRVYEFGPFRFHLDERILECNGTIVLSAGKAMDVFVVLFEGRNCPVTPKNELIAKVWGKDYGNDNFLAHAIKDLNRKLKAFDPESQYIETIWGTGYRFKGDVRGCYIAVLPFENETGDQDNEFLSDGIPESLINTLSKLPGVKVISRDTSFKFKGKEVDQQETARELGVEFIVTGRVSQRGKNLIVTAALMDPHDGTQMWGERYDRKATDLLVVLSEISRQIGKQLRLKLTSAQRRQLARPETASATAHRLLLQGLFYRRMGGTANRKTAIECFKRAIVDDDTYTLAYTELSNIYMDLCGSGVLDPKEFTPKAEEAARKALELDENLSDAHATMARTKANAWDWTGAEREFKRAIELDPSNVVAHRGYSFYLSYFGRHEEAISQIERTRELDYLSPPVHANVSWILYFAREYDRSIEAAKMALKLDQKYSLAHVYLGYNYAAKGMYTKAITPYEEAINLGHDTPSLQIYLGTACAMAGKRKRAQEILKRLQESGKYVSPAELAILYSSLGEREQTFASLETAFSAHDLQLKYLGCDPAYAGLNSDPRFADLMRRVGLMGVKFLS